MPNKKYITAKRLAELLLENPDDIICSVSDNFELHGAVIPKDSLHLFRYKGEIKSEGFRDAFDGGSYSTDVVKYDEKGELNFVQI